MDILKKFLGKYTDEREVDDTGTNPMPPDEGNNLQDVTKEK